MRLPGEYAAAHETFGRYLDGRAEPRDAEWRLKRRTLRVIRELGGDRQDRDPERAAALAEGLLAIFERPVG